MKKIKQKIQSLKSPRQKITTLINLSYFFILAKILDKISGYDQKAKIYFRRPLLPQKINDKRVERLYQLNNFLEIYESQKFREKIQKSDAEIFIDIGANVGRISNEVASRDKFSKIIAVEPNPFCQDFAQKNIPAKNRKKIQRIPTWLGEETQVQSLKTHKNDKTGPKASFAHEKSALKNTQKSDILKIETETTDFKTFREEIEIPKTAKVLMKIDVEWFENEILKSFFARKEEKKPQNKFEIIIEIWPRSTETQETLKLHKLEKLWEGHDYFFTI